MATERFIFEVTDDPQNPKRFLVYDTLIVEEIWTLSETSGMWERSTREYVNLPF